MSLINLTLAIVFAIEVLAQPQALSDVCKNNIITWKQVPHDWQEDSSKHVGEGKPDYRYKGKDWWYWKSDWAQRISTGQTGYEVAGTNQLCGSGATELKQIEQTATFDDCFQQCTFMYSTGDDQIREKCIYFAYRQWEADQAGSGRCTLYSRCGWPLVNADDYELFRLFDIYPAGFKSYNLREFSEPPTCFNVPYSKDKKVEVMIESESKDSRICIKDGADMGIGTNASVGNVATCDNGRLYACFTAATREDEDFYFYVYCDESCEASDMDLWVRVRVSERNWTQGKTSTADDIEMWCEKEKGSQAWDEDSGRWMDEFTWPSELVPDYPNKYPFRISHMNPSAALRTDVALALWLSFAFTWLL